MGVELGDHPCGGLIRESRCGPGLWGHHQPVAVPVPAHGEEPLGVRGVLEPAQTQLEQACRDGAMSELQLLGHGSEPPHRTGGDRDPRRQVSALGLDVDAPRSQHVVVSDAVDTRESPGVVDQVAHRPRRPASGSHVSPRRPPSPGPPCTGEPGLQPGMQFVHRAPPIMRLGCRGASSSGPGCLRSARSRTGRRTPESVPPPRGTGGFRGRPSRL